MPGSDPPFDDLVSEQFSPQLIDHTIGLYPRLGFKKAFTEALAEVARKKPHTAIGTPLADLTCGGLASEVLRTVTKSR